MIRLALLRHGHTNWNREGRIQGRSDIPLDEAARQTLRTLRLPVKWERATLWSSPLSRAIETARLVTGRPPRTEAALMEMNWGDWEGQHARKLHDDPEADYRGIEEWGWNYTPPGGESPAAVRARLVPWANALDRDSVAVCHIGVMRVALAHAHGWDFNGSPPFRIKRDRLYVVSINNGQWRTDADPIRLESRTS